MKLEMACDEAEGPGSARGGLGTADTRARTHCCLVTAAE